MVLGLGLGMREGLANGFAAKLRLMGSVSSEALELGFGLPKDDDLVEFIAIIVLGRIEIKERRNFD